MNEKHDETTHLPAAIRDQTYVIVAAYNEGPKIADVLSELAAYCDQVVVVDDGSTDDTFAQARRAAPFVLRHVINRGQGAALQTGMTFALARGAQYLVTFDADGQHRPEDIVRLVTPLVEKECDVTFGSRFLGDAPDMPRTRRLALRMGIFFTRLASGVTMTDAHNGLRAFSRHAAQQIHITQDRMAHASELIDLVQRSGLTFREVPVRIRYTDYSLAKGQTLKGGIRIVLDYLIGKVES